MVDMTVQSVSAGGVVLEGADGPVHATAVDEMAVGDVVRLAMRPEDVRIAEDGATPVNAIPATVAVVEYHGREFAVGATTPSGLTVHVRSEVAPRLGEEVRLTVAPERALAFRAELDSARLTSTEQDLEEVRA